MNQTEHEIQKAVIRYCRTIEKYDNRYSYIFAVPNGGKRDVRVAKKLKAEGVISGVSDLVIPLPVGFYHGAFIEVKRIGGRATDNQKTFLRIMAERGYFCAITYGYEETVEAIVKYINGEV